MYKISIHFLVISIIVSPSFLYSMEPIEDLIRTQDTPNRELIKAARENNIEGARAALARGADINGCVPRRDYSKGYSPPYYEYVYALDIAIANDFLPFVRFLLSKGAWVDFDKDKESFFSLNKPNNPPKPTLLGSRTFLTYSIDEEKWDMARLLFLFGSENKNLNINTPARIFPEPLLFAIATKDYPQYHDVVRTPFYPRYLQAALALAAGRCDNFLVRDLLEKNANPIAAFDVATGILRRSNLEPAKRNSYQEIHRLLELPGLQSCLMTLNNDPTSKAYNKLPAELIRELLLFYLWKPTV